VMMWIDYLDSMDVRKVSPDNRLAKSIIEISDRRINFLKPQKIDSNNAPIILSEYYEALHEICRAIFAVKGFKTHSHESITAFLKEVLNENEFSVIFDRYRKIRNGINYYGKTVGASEAELCSQECINAINKLKNHHLKGVL